MLSHLPELTKLFYKVFSQTSVWRAQVRVLPNHLDMIQRRYAKSVGHHRWPAIAGMTILPLEAWYSALTWVPPMIMRLLSKIRIELSPAPYPICW